MTLGLVILTSAALLAKYPNPKWHYEVQTIEAIVTKYSPKESGRIDATGHKPVEGRTVACPRRIKFGTRISIGGRLYICSDRTAIRYDGQNARFDIWTESYDTAIRWGIRKETVTVVY